MELWKEVIQVIPNFAPHPAAILSNRNNNNNNKYRMAGVGVRVGMGEELC